jgi:hypothetical protein
MEGTMPTAVMAAPDQVDPELIKLARSRPKIGIVTAAGVVFLCALFLVRVGADRRFAGEGEPTPVTVADVLAGKIGDDRYVTLAAEPQMAHAIRTTTAKGSVGLRVAPVRDTGERLWLALSGDGWEPPQASYTGRLRRLDDVAFGPSVSEFAAAHPRPVFATAAAIRAAAGGPKLATVTGEVAVAPGDRVKFDVVDPNVATLVCTFNERLPNTAAWSRALAEAGIAQTSPLHESTDTVRFEITEPDAVASLTRALEAHQLWAARVEPVTRPFETTWSSLSIVPAGFSVNGTTIPDPQIDLIGVYVARGIPAGAYALITGELPGDYWHVLPVTIALVAIGLVFAWALVRAIRRELPTRA